MALFRTKPIVIEAEQFWPDRPLPFQDQGPYVAFTPERGFYVTTIHERKGVYQTVSLAPGDWIIKEPAGPHTVAFAAYPCKPDIFAATYEPVAES